MSRKDHIKKMQDYILELEANKTIEKKVEEVVKKSFEIGTKKSKKSKQSK